MGSEDQTRLGWLSRYLDGELDEVQARAVEDRLESHADWRHEHAALLRLRQLVRADADGSVMPQLAERARWRAEALRQRGSSVDWWRSFAVRVASLVAILAGFAAMFELGRDHGQEAASQQGSERGFPMVARDGASTESGASSSELPAHIARALHTVCADLAVLDDVPAPLRRPLLQSQVQFFELEDWARRGTGPEAQLVRRLGRSLDAGRDAEPLLQVRDGPLMQAVWERPLDTRSRVGPDTRARLSSERRGQLLARLAGHLPRPQRDELDSVLGMKAHFVLGEVQGVLTHGGAFAILDQDRAHSLRPIVRLAYADALQEIGHDDLSGQLLTLILEGSSNPSRSFLGRMNRRGRTWGSSGGAQVGGARTGELWQQLLPSLHELRNATITIEERREPGRIEIRVEVEKQN